MTDEFVAWAGMSVPEPEHPTIEDEDLGVLYWHAKWQWWLGTPEFRDGRTITLRVHGPKETMEHQVCLKYLKMLLLNLRTTDVPHRARAADDLLSLYNDEWREYGDDESNIDEATFRDRLTLQAIDLEYRSSEPLSATLTYDACGMFTEHGVVVFVNESGAPVAAVME